jgi:hypothetical protein
MSDTPHTDAFNRGTFGPRREQWIDFARRLERERNEAIARYETLREEHRKINATVMFGTCPTAPKPEPFQSHE